MLLIKYKMSFVYFLIVFLIILKFKFAFLDKSLK